jgi:pilus assembly protein CpaE
VNAKGGSGATLLAANVAHVMAKKLRQSTALVDMDIQFGTLGLNLDIHPKMGIVEVLEYTDQLDAVALKAYMVNHESGVHVLATTLNNVALPREIDIGRLNRLLTTLQSTFDHTVVDLPRQIDLPTTTVLERADHVVITTQQGLSHLRDTKRLYGILHDEVGIDRERLLVVVNRYDAKAAITLDDIRKMLQDIPIELVPNDYKRVSENINLGIPLYSQSRSAPISKAVVQLAGRLSNQDMTVKKQSLLSRMIGRSIPGRRLNA